jgi:hypothetical protein
MTEKTALVFQFKISLAGIKPPIWRRIQVPADYSFWDLHVAIQDAMGWDDCHLHEFRFKNTDKQALLRIGFPDEQFDWSRETLAGWEVIISDYFNEKNQLATYLYDFGDGWMHRIRLEKIESSQSGRVYPLCLSGKRACPPDDVGGTWGYENLLVIIQDPTHKEHERMLEWVGGEYDPEDFDAKKVEFSDPDQRLLAAFNE